MTPGIVYRCYDAEGNLLYVGHTVTAIHRRMNSHRSHHRCGRGTEWFASLARVEVDHYPTWQEAYAVELGLIRTLRPRGNKQSNPDWEAGRTARRLAKQAS